MTKIMAGLSFSVNKATGVNRGKARPAITSYRSKTWGAGSATAKAAGNRMRRRSTGGNGG